MIYTLKKNGFQKNSFNKNELIKLKKIKKQILKVSQKIAKCKSLTLEKFHLLPESSINFNDMKLNIIKEINNKKYGLEIFKILKRSLIDFFGPDIAGQRGINLVIQKPNDPNFVTLHKDSPPNSPYELVVWLPLVNCKNTNGFKLLSIKKSKILEKMFLKKNNEKEYLNFAKKNAINMEVKFGEFLVFWTRVYHYAGMNKEKSTRWSLNLRYKNLFSPYGMKGYLDYFEPKNFSQVTSLSFDL